MREQQGPSSEGSAEQSAAPRPAPRPVPPKPRPIPRPAAVAPVPPPAEARAAAEAAAWGRVDPDGTVWVREAAGERSVGQYPGADSSEALAFYVRRFLDIQAQVALFESRLAQLGVAEIDSTLAALREALAEPAAVGDLDGLRHRLRTLEERAARRRRELEAERAAQREEALARRTQIVEAAEQLAGQDPERTQWKQSGQRLHELLEDWKTAQRTGPRLDRSTEERLWKRFSHARSTFDRQRRQYFARLDQLQAEAKAVKERLVARAEELSASTDWRGTAAAFRDLMDEWKGAGRAAKRDDDALWERFRAAQQRFFDARNAQLAEVDAEHEANLAAKLEVLQEAEALLPVADVAAAKAALRPLQDRWDEIGRIPRKDVQRVESRMRAVEQAVRDAERAQWRRTNPETRARAEGAAEQLHAAIEALEKENAEAVARGDEAAARSAQEALEARRTWLAQIERAADETG